MNSLLVFFVILLWVIVHLMWFISGLMGWSVGVWMLTSRLFFRSSFAFQ